MANDEREEEHQFLQGLKARTGRDLAEWMAAIAAQGFGATSDKNEIIDWLRTQGLPFARASWLERIHRNGGKPIHAGAPPADAAVEAARADARPPEPRPVPALRLVPKASQEGPAPGTKDEPPANAAAAFDRLLAAAKGYRPLYHLLEAQIRKAVPGAVFAPQARHVSVGAPREFAAITLHATEVRLGLDLGDRLFDGGLQKAKLRGPGPAITHMLVLTDARQIDDALSALVASANARVNHGPG
jgi:uncharacterized protein DUF5655